ncbi:uncharacterized protein ARMOST_02474 [Armillaria ostoyae]|uniref:Uncharacterized protein n=1 Tax=Armillaria ostoyae TaxID=47428 RepID=A0A284QRS9_ARMOS|nr:uncharacterized protein ARMOST_02474 [Armillaria ostoyae]
MTKMIKSLYKRR